ncbi:MAG: hypothetical protein LQ348_002449 [Seirophora lacunosa]|nr:MAG: hypothetical protein LQ348_002449 [Seirophora lacunosa]
MRPTRPTQQPNVDYPQIGPTYPSNNAPFPDAQRGLPMTTAPWPDAVDNVQQSVPQAGTGSSRPAPAGEHTKHRRTRSGCYTCRHRRVKCDEARPVCERCVKGSRECTYPEPRPKTRTRSSKSDAAQTATTVAEDSSSEEETAESLKKTGSAEGYKSGGKGKKPEVGSRKQARGKGTAFRKQDAHSRRQPIPSIEQIKEEFEVRESAETDGSSPLSASQAGSRHSRQLDNLTSESSMSPEKVSFSHLPQHQRFYLEYLREHITYHHYFFRNNANYFLHNILIEHALSYEPLLHAVVGFAAFHATLGKSDGRIQDFLGFYNKAVSLLRKSLAGGQRHTVTMLLTILQLATFEEYLGDWVNLIGHQKAAFSMLTEFYSADSIMENELGRKILAWYARFDLFAGFMSGYETVLGREWLGANERHHTEQAQRYPEDIHLQIEAGIASHRLIALDMALLFGKLKTGNIALPDFQRENDVLEARIKHWKQGLEPLLTDDRFLVTSFEGAPKRDPDDIVDPYRPGSFLGGPLFQMNLVLIDWLGTSIMHVYQTALILRRPPPPGLPDMALEVCRLFETVQYWPGSHAGSILSAQAGIGIAALFLPKDERHTMWCRRKLATIESQGYTYPPTLRAKMAGLWGIPEIVHWWLPNDEGYRPIVRSIRSFAEDRNPKTGSQTTEDLRAMKGLFDNLDINDSKDTRRTQA